MEQFLSVELGETGVLYFKRCTGISVTERNRLYNHLYFEIPDTIYVEDPVTSEVYRTTVQRDSSGLRTLDSQSLSLFIPYDRIVSLMKEQSWHMYKADIDRNGNTDLVIDIGMSGTIVLMDMGERVEGHALLDNKDFLSYSFRKFTLLPDGSTALVLRHNPCTLRERTARPSTISYITDTITGGTSGGSRIDTMYKIVTIIDSIYNWNAGKPYYSYRCVQSDTVDMKRYHVYDTLVYQFDGFVKYNAHSIHKSIAKIVYHKIFSSDDPMNACVEVNVNGACYLRFEEHDATFSGTINRAELVSLWGLAEYLDIDRNEYSDNCNDDQIRHGNVFVIQFEDGTIKEIVFGKCTPPMGLGYLSKKLSDISRTVYWQPAEKCSVPECICKHKPEVQWSGARCDCASIDEVW
ncbi:MAG: hypothetical protein KDC07_00990 [Chitinophagaceae bacterium]|nr:hypothetical protein [Chitinophagaceae bacterium]